MTDPTPVTPVVETKPTFGAWLKSVFYGIGNLFIRYPLASIATIVIVLGGVILVAMGQKIQIGGVLGWLWGKVTHDTNTTTTVVPTPVTPPPNRVEPGTNIPIPPGTTDPNGFTQVGTVVPITPPGLFSDPTTVTVTPPGGSPVTIKLPTGMTNSNVQSVIMVAPNVFQIANNDSGTNVDQVITELNS